MLVKLDEMDFEIVDVLNEKKYFPRNNKAKYHVISGFRDGIYTYNEKFQIYITNREFKILKRCVKFCNTVDRIFEYFVG